MKELMKSENIETVEAELLGKNFKHRNEEKYQEFYSSDIDSRFSSKLKKYFLNFLFLISFSFIFAGLLLCFTIIGAFIGIPLIIIGTIILFLTIKLFFKSKFFIKL